MKIQKYNNYIPAEWSCIERGDKIKNKIYILINRIIFDNKKWVILQSEKEVKNNTTKGIYIKEVKQ